MHHEGNELKLITIWLNTAPFNYLSCVPMLSICEWSSSSLNDIVNPFSCLYASAYVTEGGTFYDGNRKIVNCYDLPTLLQLPLPGGGYTLFQWTSFWFNSVSREMPRTGKVLKVRCYTSHF